MSLISGKRMQCLMEEVLKYHNGYYIHKLQANVNLKQNQQRSFILSEAYAMVVARRVYIYITMVNIYTNYGHTLTMVFFQEF